MEEKLRPVEGLFAHLPAVTVSGAQATRFGNGGQLDLNRVGAFRRKKPEAGLVFRVKTEDGAFLGLGKTEPEQLAIYKLF